MSETAPASAVPAIRLHRRLQRTDHRLPVTAYFSPPTPKLSEHPPLSPHSDLLTSGFYTGIENTIQHSHHILLSPPLSSIRLTNQIIVTVKGRLGSSV